jgi:toxin ParE1/3/4
MKIRWSRLAADDLTRIIEFIHEDSPDASLRVGRGICKAIAELAKFPKLGRAGRVQGTRELPVPPLPFFVVYRLKDEAVEIVRILHGAQRWP